MEPNGPKGTGQPCALTDSVAATPKSWFDCITAGEKPSGIERADHLAPARAGRHAIGAGAAVHLDPGSAAGLHVEGHGDAVTDSACPPIECRAAPTETGRPSAAAVLSSARSASSHASPVTGEGRQ